MYLRYSHFSWKKEIFPLALQCLIKPLFLGCAQSKRESGPHQRGRQRLGRKETTVCDNGDGISHRMNLPSRKAPRQSFVCATVKVVHQLGW